MYNPRTQTDAIVEGEWIEHVLDIGDHTSSMRHQVRWTDYRPSDKEGSSCHTTTTMTMA